MKIKYIKIISIFLLIFLYSCSSDEIKIQKKLFQFEQSLTTMIKNHDTTAFLNNFTTSDDIQEEILLQLGEMSFIYEYTPSYIKNAIDKKTAIYGRIFSSNENSIYSFLPDDGNYDVNITMRLYKDNYIALIRYGTDDYKEVNSVEFVLIYTKNKWKILTVNFFEI